MRRAGLVTRAWESAKLGLSGEQGVRTSRLRQTPLPDRVLAEIHAEDDRSEQLIGFVQLGLALTFAMLYAIAPKPIDAGTSRLAPVPLALVVYVSFTVVRIALSYRGRLSPLLLGLSIVADITLLFGLIWSFHWQYGQPAAFSLKVPTFAYVFVFVVLRALRFESRYVLIAGGTAVAGWIMLVAAAIQSSEPGTVTRSFASYLNGNAILLGAELDKVIAIVAVTTVLWLVIQRARRLLTAAVREGAAVREVGRFLSAGVADVIAGAEQPVRAGQAETRDVAVIMLDLRGFTRYSATLAPHEVVETLVRFHAAVVPIVQRHGGVIDKFLGDGVMVTFGAVEPTGTAAADAMRALVEIMESGSRTPLTRGTNGIQNPLELNGAMCAGPVVFAAIGSGERLEFTVIGETVNLAAKLEKHNKTARTRALTTATSWALARAQGYLPVETVQLMPGVRISGVDQPLDLVAIGRRS